MSGRIPVVSGVKWVVPVAVAFGMFVQSSALRGATEEDAQATPAPAARPPAVRPTLFFSETWKNTIGKQHLASSADLSSPNLELKLYGASLTCHSPEET